jgi:hypothetical protein
MIRSVGSWQRRIWRVGWTGGSSLCAGMRRELKADWCEYRNLMARDEFKNLGFAEDAPATAEKKPGAGGAEEEKGAKGELRW